MKRCVWLLEDSLGACDPALAANPQAPAVFVFDEEHYRENPISFKRLFFVYESVVETFAGREAPGELRKGSVVSEVFDFCRKHRVEEIHVTRAPWRLYRQVAEQLRANFVVVEHSPEALVRWRKRLPRRFMDFWKEALPEALPEESGF